MKVLVNSDVHLKELKVSHYVLNALLNALRVGASETRFLSGFAYAVSI